MANKNNAVSARAFRNKKARRANADKQKKKKATSGADVAKTISKAATAARRTGDETQQSYINDSKLKRNGKQAQKNNDIVVGRSKQQTKKQDKFQTRASIKDNEYGKKTNDNIKGLTKGNLRHIVASRARTLGVASENMDVQPRTSAGSIVNNKTSKQVAEANKKVTNAKKAENPLSDWASKQLEKSAKEIEKQKKGMSEAGKFAADVYGAGLGLATDALAGPFAVGSMFSRSFGSAYDSAEKEGASKGQAMLYGATIGGVEAATEKLFAVAKPLQKIYGKGAADDLTERVLNKMVGKRSGTGKGDLLYHGGKTFAAALTEGLEEMIAEGLEPTIANQIYADAIGKHKETDPGQVLYAGAVGGALGGILGGGGQVVEYSQGSQVRDVFGEEGIADMLKKAVESDDAADAVKATAMKAMVDNGDGIVAGQANQLKQVVDAQNARDTERLQLASDSAVKIMRDNKYIDIVQKIDENGTLELSEHTRTAYEDTKGRAVQEFENNTDFQLPEQTVDQITSAIASIKTGAVMDIDAVNMFTVNNPEARAVYETVTGETLPKTNAETRDYLYLKIAENRVSSAEAETNYFVDRLRGVLEQDIATTYDAKGQEAFSDVIAHINPANAGQVQASIVTFEDYYEAGRRGESLEFMNSLDNPVYNALPAEVRKAAYEAGSMDQNASVASVKGVALQLGQKAELNRSQTKTGGQRGKVTSRLSKENRSRFTAQQQIMYRKLAQVFNINIEITDDPNMNGFYNNGTITLSVNADRDLAYVFAHEITHHMELYAPEEYLRFKDLVRSSWDYDGLNGALDAKIRHYADHGVKLSREGALDEILADSTYEMIQDENFVEELCREDRGMAKAILDALKALIKKLRAVLVDGNKFTPAQNEGLLSQLDILKDAKKLWTDGLMKAAEVGSLIHGMNTAEITYDSLISKPDMNVVQLANPSKKISRKDVVDLGRNNVKDVGDVDERNRLFVLNKDTGKNIIVGAPAIRHGLNRDYETHAMIATKLGEYLQNAVKVNEVVPREIEAVDGYVLLGYGVSEDGNQYPAYFVVRTLTTGTDELVEFDSLYSINGKKIVEAVGGANQGVQSLSSTTISIADLLEIVNETYSDILPKSVAEHFGTPRKKSKLGDSVKFSLKDSTGRELSPQQAEFFKDSKVRDENGNLLVMYHGTDSYEDFNVFKSGKAGYLGKGMYFSDSESYAKRYATKNGYDGRVYETYLNVKNPLVVTSENPAVEILGEKLAARREKNNSFSTTWIKPSDIKKLVDKGYDGIIWKYGPTIEVSVWNPNQIKNIDNENPTDNPDIRYSLKDNKGRELSPAQQEYFKHVSPKLKDEDGNLKRYHHGTSRGDRVGTIFDPERATSGPMPFFTDDFDIATNYSRDKRDTSMAYDSDYYSYETQFRVEIDGDDMSLIDAWRYLPGDARERIKDRAEHTHYDWDDYETLVYDEDTNDAGGGFQWQIKEARGNIFRALCEQWLNSGTLFNNEAEYMNVLEFVGVNEEFEKLGYGKPYYKDPDYREEKVYEVYLNITNPFDTADVDEEFLADLTDYIENTDMSIYDVDTADADPWDKRNWDPEEWLEKLERDIEEGTAYAWTSIPDVVTDFLKDYLEADGIVDTGGKRGGQTHQVVIPFYSEQIKNIDNENPTNDPDIRYSFKDDIDEDAVNNYVNEHPEDFPDSIPYWEYERDAARVKDQTIGELRNQVTRMKLDKLLTHGRVLDTSSVKEEVNSLVRMLMTSAEGTTAKTNLKLVDQITENVQGIYRTLKAGNEEDATIDAYNLAEDIVENLQLVNDEMFHTYKDLRDYLRTTKVYISEEDKSNIPDFKDFRRRNMGRLLIVNEGNGGTSIDNMYMELCQMYPGMFDEELTHPADQLQEIADVRESLEPYDIALNDEETIQLIKETAHDLIEIAANGKPWVSWADRQREAYEGKVEALKQKHKEAIRDIKRKEKDRYDSKLAVQKVKADERVQKVKEKGEEKLQAEKDKNKQQRQDQREARQKKELIRKMEKNIQWLSDRLLKPTDDKHLPHGYDKAIAELLCVLDTQTERSKKLEEKYGISKKRFRFLELKKQYEAVAKSEDQGIVFNEDLADMMSKLSDVLEDVTIAEATVNDTEQIYKLLKGITHGLRKQNEFFNDKIKSTRTEAGESIIDNFKNRVDQKGIFEEKKKLAGYLEDLIAADCVSPTEFFDVLGNDKLTELFAEVRKGQDVHIRHTDEARKYFQEHFPQWFNVKRPGSKIEKWGNGKIILEVKLDSGRTIKLTPTQAMTIYAHSFRTQSMAHMTQSGIQLTPIEKVGLFKQMLGRKFTQEKVRLTYGDIEKIKSKLTTEQKKTADAMINFIQTECTAWGNETSMKLHGYEKFKEENYFPIKTSSDYRMTDLNNNEKDVVKSIRNLGMTKAVVPNANNVMVIDDFFDVVTSHINEMSLYHALAVPMADLELTYNYISRNEDGIQEMSVKGAMASAWGRKANNYLETFIRDVNSEANIYGDALTGLLDHLLAAYKKATIGFNARVAVQQPTAIVRAMGIINPKYFVNANTINPKAILSKNIQEMQEHCPIALWKAWGRSQTDVSQGMKETIMNRDWTIVDVFTMRGYGYLDNITWGLIWQAVKKEVKANNPEVKVGSDEFWELCNERASYVFDRTMVVDSVFHRTQVMRKKDPLHKTLTSFMAEPLKTLNQVRTQIIVGARRISDGDKGGAVQIAKALGVYVSQAIAVSAAAGIIDMLRGKDLDDDDEGEGWLEQFINNFITNINPFNMIPLVGDISDITKGYGTSFMPLEGIEAVWDSIEGWIKYHNGNSDTTVGELMKDTSSALGMITGLPIKNLLRELETWMPVFGLEVFAATAEEEPKEPKKGLLDRAFDGMGIKDGSNIDKTLNFFGLNRTDAEQAAYERERTVKALNKQTKNMSDKERADHVWGEVMSGYTKDLETGNIQAVIERRKILEAAGGDVDKFDKNVLGETKTAFKKTIGDPDKAEAAAVLRDYLKTEHGYTDAKISNEILTKTDTAKEFQLALCTNDQATAISALYDLVEAGLTYEDYCALYLGRASAIQGNDYSTGEFNAPVTGTVTSTFGYRDAPTAGASTYHQGIDIAAPEGTVVGAADGGKVSSVGYSKTKGNYVTIYHGNGRYTEYLHLWGYNVQKGDAVLPGQEIGKVGSTGVSTGPHLHFAVKESGTYVDPAGYIGL